MGLDVRLPIGLMFLLLGAILVAAGFSCASPLDRWTGAAMLGFGTVLLALVSSSVQRQSRRR